MELIRHLHPATVHFPIALLLVASAAGLAYLFWRPLPMLRVLFQATLVLGWIACAVALLTGLLAQSGLAPQAPFRPVLNLHISAGIATLLVYGLLMYLGWIQRARAARPPRKGLRISSPPPAELLDDPARRGLSATLLILGALLVLATGWNGGQLVYVWGVNVLR